MRIIGAGGSARQLRVQQRLQDTGRCLLASASFSGATAWGARGTMWWEKGSSALAKMPLCHRGVLGRPFREDHPPAAPPRSEESFCLSSAMSNIQPFVSLGAIFNCVPSKYRRQMSTAALSPLQGKPGSLGALAVLWKGLVPARLGREGQCNRANGTVAPRRRLADTRQSCPGSHIPKYPGSLEHP